MSTYINTRFFTFCEWTLSGDLFDEILSFIPPYPYLPHLRQVCLTWREEIDTQVALNVQTLDFRGMKFSARQMRAGSLPAILQKCFQTYPNIQNLMVDLAQLRSNVTNDLDKTLVDLSFLFLEHAPAEMVSQPIAPHLKTIQILHSDESVHIPSGFITQIFRGMQNPLVSLMKHGRRYRKVPLLQLVNTTAIPGTVQIYPHEILFAEKTELYFVEYQPYSQQYKSVPFPRNAEEFDTFLETLKSHLHVPISSISPAVMNIAMDRGCWQVVKKMLLAGLKGSVRLFTQALYSDLFDIAELIKSSLTENGKAEASMSFLISLVESNATSARVESFLRTMDNFSAHVGGKYSPLALAVMQGNASLVALLLKYGHYNEQLPVNKRLNLSARTWRDNSLLVEACAIGNIEIVKMLLDSIPIEKSIFDSRNLNPLDIAEQHGFDEIAALLRSKTYNLQTGVQPLHVLPESDHTIPQEYLGPSSTDFARHFGEGDADVTGMQQGGTGELSIEGPPSSALALIRQ